MKSSKYWRERFKQLEVAQNALGKKAFDEIEKQYRTAIKDIEADIDKWYRRFAENNNISMADARKWLTGTDLKEFKWSVQEYIKYGEEHALKGVWAKELENASAKFHISRLDALKINTKASLERLFTDQNETITGALGEVFRSGYYHTAFEIQKGFGVGFDIGRINNDYLSKVLSKPWAVDGKNFSERVWNNKEKLIKELHTGLTRNIITGADPQKAIDAISHKLNVSKSDAGRLIMTEEAYFSSAAQKECFDNLGVEEFEIVATLDDRTSSVCQDMDGQHFPQKDFEPGITAPPFHVNCRSTTCPYFDDEFSLGERAARDGDGQTYYVPSDMKYPEWKERFVDGGDKGDLHDHTKSLQMKAPLQKSDIRGSTQVGAKSVTISETGIKAEPTQKMAYITPKTGKPSAGSAVRGGSTVSPIDVTEEYISKASPGMGKIEFEKGFDVGANANEVRTAQWLHDTFGGDIVLLKAINEQNVKTPDYLWRGKLWELKSVTTAKAADSAVRAGLKQITKNPGGLILDYSNNSIDLGEVQKVIEGRMRRGFEQTTDVMVVLEETLAIVLRFQK